ncbi:hypothetical protein J7T55_008113 [Diaporthe amygdali]|uniref:uncharacterized protein n=1 Tax=Phomopsis amygdali TaxID=1214568 RepID=UPI0022FF2A5B|nr:uncharacterized protein J7T55_008113 [Diaporthe amygdali]KAJ0107977.1 hypothetical protein J7T55_008113 [Diaporthe amygdali]
MNFFNWARGSDGPAPSVAGQPPGQAPDGADAGAGAGARSRPAPLDLNNNAMTDDEKWTRSKNRWRLAIKPDDPDFVQQRRVFEDALDPGSGQSIDDILTAHFARYEAQKFSGYVERKREPDLYRQQRSDADAYNTLLKRPPWDQEAPNAFLAFKLTMLYFGFPVEPMKMNDFFRLPPGSGLFGIDDDDDDDDDLDDNRTFIPEDMRPLRFLNNYENRSYGADNGHLMPDPTYEAFYGLPYNPPPEGQQVGHEGTGTGPQADMRIRGRGLGEDDDVDLMSEDSIDGASFSSDSLLPDAPEDDGGDTGVLNLRGGAGRAAPDDGTAQNHTHNHHRNQNWQTQTGQAQDTHHHHQNGHTQTGQLGHDQGILDQGVPHLATAVDAFQSGKYYRERSYASPMSVQVGDQHPKFPINAPAIEQIRRPQAAGGLEADSMPIVSTQIMTPTEQRALQQAFFQMRAIALNRGQQCPHPGCDAYFPVGPNNMAAFHAHLDEKHVGTHCPFCTETLFSYWSEAQKEKHFVSKHSEYFTKRGDLLREAMLAASIPSKGNVHRREEQYNFCPRCGRDHQTLSSKADRVHHDNACFPGNEATVPTTQYCKRCGQPEHVLVGPGIDKQRQQHQCTAAGTDPDHQEPASAIFCPQCALKCHELPVSYGRRHLFHCKPLGSRADSWCPWCGIDLKSGPRPIRLKHLAGCALRPASGQNPIDTDSGIPHESPRDVRAHRLVHGLSNLGRNNGRERLRVPPKCPVDGCDADLSTWNARGLYLHFQTHPENTLEASGGLKSCPFCKCDFGMRGWTTNVEKQQHFQDHLEGRYKRLLADEVIGTNPDRESAIVRDAILTRDNDEFDQQAEINSLLAETVQQAESIKHLSTELRKVRVVEPRRERRPVPETVNLSTPRGTESGGTHMPITPPFPVVAARRGAARASRPNTSSRTPASVSKRKDGYDGQLAGRPEKKSKIVQQGPSSTTISGFATGRHLSTSVPAAGEDDNYDDEDEDDEGEEEDQLELEEVDMDDGIVDEDEDDYDSYSDDHDELAD